MLAALEERAERAEAEQLAQVAEARRTERNLIAAEMHDRLAHRLSLLSLQAGALELRLEAPAQRRAEAARVIRATSDDALDDLRSVIGLLREPSPGALTPQPGLADIDTLIEEGRAVGMTIDADIVPAQAAGLPEVVGHHVFVVVRESLTNARKHAQGQPADPWRIGVGRASSRRGAADHGHVDMNAAAPVRVVVVDDDPLVRAGLRLLLDGDEIVVVGEAGDGPTALGAIDAVQPDVVLMDIRMPGMDGLTATELIRAPDAPPEVIVLTTFDTDEHVLRALRGGAAGFLLKDTAPQALIEAVVRVAAGDAQFSPSVLRQIIASAIAHRPPTQATDRLAGLTERERAVADAVGEGLSNAEIAQRLYLSVATVKAHLTTIFGKLAVANRVQLALLVHEHRADAGL